MLPPEDSCITQYENKHKHDMRYKGELIDEPMLWMFLEYAKENNLECDPIRTFEYYRSRGWKISKGRKTTSVEEMLNTNWREYFKKIEKSKCKSKARRHKSRKIKKQWRPYDEQLTDEKWYAFRRKVFAVRGHRCERCGTTENLQIHHPKYIRGHLAWEYEVSEVIVLCRKCHMKEHNITEEK